MERKPAAAPKWKEIEKGVSVLQLWESIGPKWPQIVVLRLNETKYKELLKKPEQYINNLGVLGDSSTHKVVRCRLPAVKKAAADTTEYIVVCIHEFETISFVVSSSRVEF